MALGLLAGGCGDDDGAPADAAGDDGDARDGAGPDGDGEAEAYDSGPPPDCALPNVRCVDDTPGSTQEYATIGECAAVAVAGDTCLVHAGSYDERVEPAASGEPGNPIVFQAAGAAVARGFTLAERSHIRVVGFELTNAGLSTDRVATVFLQSSNDVWIVGNRIHDTDGGYCIRLRDVDGPATASSDNVIRDNVLTRCSALSDTAVGLGINVYGHRNLVEGNDISHLGDDFVRVTGGDFNVVRNNRFHDNSLDDWPGSGAHIDGLQNWCTEDGLPTHHLLVENNELRNAPSTDTHFVIYQDEGGCGNAGFIVRYNTVRDLGSYVQINDHRTAGVRLYGNTFAATGVAYTPRGWDAVGFQNGSSGGALINNIFYDTVRDGGTVYGVDDSSRPGFVARNNLAFNTSCGTGCTWGSPMRDEPGAVLSRDPLFVGPDDPGLQAGSPAIDAGGPLTEVATADPGDGTTLIVGDAGLFQDGWAGCDPDWIAVGTTENAAAVVAVDDASNTLTLAAPLVRAAGDPVWLYRDSDGTPVLLGAAPDIGAREHPGGK